MRIGLALSGGGFRATLYHLGVIRHLRDANLLESVTHITSVSGGSVLGAHLTLNWDRYCGDSNEFDSAAGELLDFVRLDVRNRIVRRYPFIVATNLARRVSLLKRKRALTRTLLLEQYYQQHLFGDTCLYQLPDAPELHILCTNLSGGGLSSFSRDGLWMENRDSSGKSTMQLHQVGLATVPMAVAASSAFPGFFPPLELTAETVGAVEGEFQTQFFTDGGVYDNLGIRMFHHINQRIKGTVGHLDFVDIQEAMELWNRVAKKQEATPLGRLAEIHAQSRPNGPEDGPMQEPQQFLQGLCALISNRNLQQDEQFQELLAEVPPSENLADEVPSNGYSDGYPSEYSDESCIESSNGYVNENRPPQRDPVMRNRQLLAMAFRKTTGKDIFRPNDQPFDIILASDAGKKIQVSCNERIGGLLSTAMRSSDILMDRVWQLEQEHFRDAKGVVFSPITRIVSLEEDSTALHPEVQQQVSHIRTDMDRFNDREVSGLIRHGYCVARQTLAETSKVPTESDDRQPPWDPTSQASHATSQSPISSGRRGAAATHSTAEARKLQASSRRRYWSMVTAPRDWATYLYIPVLLLLFGLLPWMGWKYYQHIRINAMLSGAITQSRQDYNHLLALLEYGPVEPWEATDFVEADTPRPLFATQGLDMICDARIVDLRNWDFQTPGQTKLPGRRIYVCRHVAIRKIAETEGPTALRLQSLWDSDDVMIRCLNTELSPIIRRCKLSEDGKPDRYLWEVQLDFSNIAVGETAHLVVETMVLDTSHDRDFAKKEWWRYEVDGEPELAASWVLLPEDRRYTNFNLVKYDYEKHERVTIVHPTRQSVIRHGTILNWAVVHPDPDVTYSCRWSLEL